MTEMYRIEKRWTPEGIEMLKRENPNFKNQSVLNGEWVPFKFGKADLGSLTKEKAEEWVSKLQNPDGHVEVRMVPVDNENMQETLNESKQKLRTEMLAGIITETQYREECEKLTLTEARASDKKSLKENISYPDVINGNSTPKKDYEMAFEHFIGGKLNEEEETGYNNKTLAGYDKWPDLILDFCIETLSDDEDEIEETVNALRAAADRLEKQLD